MKEITKTYNVYEYAELSETAKEKAKQDYLQDNSCFLAEDFTEDCLTVLSEKYPNSELKIQWDVSCCQGNGVNIYGKFNLQDFDYSGECNVNWITKNCQEITLEENLRYAYSLKNFDNHRENAVNEIAMEIENNLLEYADINNTGINIITDFVNSLFDELNKLEQQFYSVGDEWLNNVSDETMIEISDANGYLYLENGELF